MRRILTACLLLSAPTILPCIAAADPAPDDAAAIIAKAIKAHGGAEALTKYKATQASSKGKITLPGVGEVECTQEVATMLPDKVKETVHLTVNGNPIDVVTVMNGDTFSIEAAGKDVPITDDIKKTLKEARYTIGVARLVALVRDKGFELSVIGEDKVEGKPAVGVLVKSEGHRDVSLYFDKGTGLLAKVERRAVDPLSGKEFSEERIILSYGEKGKEGIAPPKEVLVKRDGETFLRAEAVWVSLFESLDDSVFKK